MVKSQRYLFLKITQDLETTIPSFYQVHQGTKDYGTEETGRVIPFIKICKELGLP